MVASVVLGAHMAGVDPIHLVAIAIAAHKGVTMAVLSIPITGYNRPCVPDQGGISRMWVADPADFDWTQATSADPYTAVALNDGATILGGSGFFRIDFNYQEASYKAAQTLKGTANKWAYTVTCQLPFIDNKLNQFLATMQNAVTCSGLLLVVQFNTGTIIVMGERFVNSNELDALWRIALDGSDEDSGKVFDDFSGANVSFKSDYFRVPYEFTGGLAAIQALEGTGF